MGWCLQCNGVSVSIYNFDFPAHLWHEVQTFNHKMYFSSMYSGATAALLVIHFHCVCCKLQFLD